MDKEKVLKELDECNRPLFFYDDDCDGLCSFLQLYCYKREGNGVCVKISPLDDRLVRKVEEYDPDKVFILDIPVVTDDFFDKVKVPIIWIDHHPAEKRSGIIQYNPRLEGKDSVPASGLCYDIVKHNLWFAVTGMISDWTYPKNLVKEFRKRYPGLLPSNIRTPEKALFSSKVGELAKIFNFLLKGNNINVKKCVNILTRIDDPNEILNQTTPQGKFLYKQYLQLSKEYNTYLSEAEKILSKDIFLIYKYRSSQSITSLLSNELLFKYPDKIILVVRETSDYYKGSLRSPKHLTISDVLEKALVNIEGHGGGHENACGLGIKKECWDLFLEQLKSELNKKCSKVKK